MSAKTQPNTLGDVLKWEQENRYSREIITVLSGAILSLLAVFGYVRKALASAAIPAVSGTGNGLMSALSAGPDVQTGSYVITCITAATNGGTFSVTAPDGTVLPNATVGTAYTSSHLNFLISDGATDFVAGDSFTVAVTAGGTPTAVGTGNGAISSISMGPDTQHGTYRLECTAAGTDTATFSVTAPDGTALPEATTDLAYANDQINFTIADGATDFVVGDYFNIIVAAGSGKAKAIDFDAVDGSQIAAGFSIDTYDASLADVSGVGIVRDAIIVADDLVWPTGTTSAQKASALAQMKEAGIVTRSES